MEIWREELQETSARGNSLWLHDLEYGHLAALSCSENVTFPMSPISFHVLFLLHLSVLGGKIPLATTIKK